MFSLQHLFLMLPEPSLCPGREDWSDLWYRSGSTGPSLTHKRLNSKQGGNTFIITSDQDLFPEGLWSRKLWSYRCVHACISVCKSEDNWPGSEDCYSENNKTLSSTLRKMQKQMIRESKKARETEIKRKNQGEDDFLSTKQQGRILVHLIGNVSFLCKHRLEPALISQIKAF